MGGVNLSLSQNEVIAAKSIGIKNPVENLMNAKINEMREFEAINGFPKPGKNLNSDHDEI
jgi:hypothetical protein